MIQLLDIKRNKKRVLIIIINTLNSLICLLM
nr:MAG TPA: hypothetical protein [Caudoviricetes sp.]